MTLLGAQFAFFFSFLFMLLGTFFVGYNIGLERKQL